MLCPKLALNPKTGRLKDKEKLSIERKGGEHRKPRFSGSMIPIQYQLLIVTPEVSLNMDTFVALWQSNLPAEFLYSHFLGMVLGYAICWRIVTVSLVVFLCDWAPSLRSWKAVGLDIFILLATNVCTVTGLYTSQYAYRHGVVAASVWLLTACLLACLFQLRPGKFCTREATE
ncbi:unnamed protein product [Symbiodinium natans]|uniref:Uncharacterized protein n=1 Tax=Symbiodinium natans TaxID=878477 RepID=A0A812IAE9_9DINO|nr:unnamed protein product [Symbiodinium natans]